MNFTRKGDFYFSLSKKKVYLIASTHNASLKSDADVIQKLKQIQYEGNVFIDMLLKNGNISTRFLSVFFDGKSFKVNKSEILEDKNEFLTIEKDFYIKHPTIVEDSILSRSEKWELLNGESI